MNVSVRPPRVIPYSVDGLLSLLEPGESAALRLGDRRLGGRLRKVWSDDGFGRKGEARLEANPTVDELVPLLDVEVWFSEAAYRELVDESRPPERVVVLHVRRLPGLEELLP